MSLEQERLQRALADVARLMGDAPKPTFAAPPICAEPPRPPTRDYRKELWIAHWASIPATTTFSAAVESTHRVVAEFDKFFSQESGK